MESEPGRRRLPELTSLRFFAALAVVIYHLRAMGVTTAVPDWYRKLAGIGYVGVTFFFVLSGFILVYTYAGRTFTPQAFWRARFARIYPAYLFSLLLALPLFLGSLAKVPFYAWAAKHLKFDYFLVLACLQAWHPLAALSWNPVAWSLSVEAFFYLLFPYLLPLIGKRTSKHLAFLIFACWLTSLAVSLLYVWLKPDGINWATDANDTAFWLAALKFNPLVRLPEFLIGMAGGLLFINRERNSARSAPLVLTGVLAVSLVTLSQGVIPFPLIHDALLAPAFIAIIYGFAMQPSWGAVLRQPFLAFLGDASYSLYLLHGTVIVAFFFLLGPRLGLPLPVALSIYSVLTIVLALAVYKFIEDPARRWLNPRRTIMPVKPLHATATAPH